MTAAIEAVTLTMTYGDLRAVDAVNVTVRGEGPGEALLPMAIPAGFAQVAGRLFRWETASCSW